MLNTVVLVGRLTRDPEVRYTGAGTPLARFTLAVDRPFTNQQGEREADFIDIVAWRQLAETVSAHLSKGRLVAVQGRIQVRSFETQDGQRRRMTEVVATTVRFLDRPRGDSPADVQVRGQGGPAAAPPDEEGGVGDDEVPF